ncbi:MAG: glutathione-regulated potassium-efflux system protein KefC [Methanocella sp. PtaU1.Bin125]|nr:MAG: glutathione-regulated potassium-efflux system protein KefC [Methanocella sp. PtaU1.Bin125]
MLDSTLLLWILLILGLGKLLGMIAERFGFPSIIGELLVGIVLGPMALGIITPAGDNIVNWENLAVLANLGVMFMMFIMGLSINMETVMKNNARSATAITLIGASLVFLGAAAATLIIDLAMGQELYFSIAQACIVGVALTSTSTVIGFRYLSEIGDRFSNVFKTLVAVEVTDGIFSIVLLAVFLSVLGAFTGMVNGGNVDIGQFLPVIGWKAFTLLMLVIGFMIFVIKFGGRVANWLLGVSRKTGEDQSIITLSLIILFAVAALSDWLELTAVIGAFLAGAILAGSPFSETVIAPKIKAVGYGLFIPIFFAFTGLQMDFGAILGGAALQLPAGIGIPYYLILFVLLLAAVIAFKYMGAIMGCTYAGGFKLKDARKIGCSAICVGEDTLVIAQIGAMVMFTAGMPLITPAIFSVLGLLIIVTSVLTPLLLKWAFSVNETPLMATQRSGGARSKRRSI